MTMKREVADHQRDRVDCMHCAGSALYTHTMCTHTPHISAFDSAPIPLLSLLLVFVEREREMGTLPPRSVAVDDARVEDAKVGQEEADRDRQQKQLDAGALFVLKSKGSWVHCGYHLTTSIVAPPLLSLPYAFTFLGCMAGILCLVIEALVTFYSYNLISLVFENYAQLGRRHLRLRDMALDILGCFLMLCCVTPTPNLNRIFTKFEFILLLKLFLGLNVCARGALFPFWSPLPVLLSSLFPLAT
nr:probable GABA transporter 2 isoform X1 [Malus domestica]